MIDSCAQYGRSGVIAPLAGHWQEARLLLSLDADLGRRRWLVQICDQLSQRPLRRLDLDQTIRSLGKTLAL
ncbi:hypothetical protein GWK36_05790 [Caldichromatium japonicum]|uniref:Uncharacterized protein n=1 Tax=Caldichromatium japonicum TaxID=2699430 RepID=A0A6G7VC94_9GAMM|nr:hypothetical protein [Caldichromatium japonicum]QIK37572.1 hypothetical protein GWK36_05790 [Caldichromatium japonicum]